MSEWKPMSTTLSSLETDVLRCCAGQVVKLPYDWRQEQATIRLRMLGLIEFEYVDDQPTHYATDAGMAHVAALAPRV